MSQILASLSQVVQISQAPVFDDPDEVLVQTKKDVLAKVHALVYHIAMQDYESYQWVIILCSLF